MLITTNLTEYTGENYVKSNVWEPGLLEGAKAARKMIGSRSR